MKRRHSIALGFGALLSVAYLILVGVYLYGVIQENQVGMQALLMETTLQELTPHLACTALGALLIIIAFFSSNLTLSVLACSCFLLAVMLALGDYYQYAILCAPSILFAFIGCFFCHKRKLRLKEEAEEEAYREYHAKVKAASRQKSIQRLNMESEKMNQPRQRHNNGKSANASAQRQQNYYRHPYAQAPAPMQNNFAMLQNQQPNYAYPYPMNPYGMDAMMQMPSPYDPLIMNQGEQGETNQASMQGEQGGQYPTYPYQQQRPISAAAFQNPDYQITGSERTLADGYFDDYGTFHPGNSNNF